MQLNRLRDAPHVTRARRLEMEQPGERRPTPSRNRLRRPGVIKDFAQFGDDVVEVVDDLTVARLIVHGLGDGGHQPRPILVCRVAANQTQSDAVAADGVVQVLLIEVQTVAIAQQPGIDRNRLFQDPLGQRKSEATGAAGSEIPCAPFPLWHAPVERIEQLAPIGGAVGTGERERLRRVDAEPLGVGDRLSERRTVPPVPEPQTERPAVFHARLERDGALGGRRRLAQIDCFGEVRAVGAVVAPPQQRGEAKVPTRTRDRPDRCEGDEVAVYLHQFVKVCRSAR